MLLQTAFAPKGPVYFVGSAAAVNCLSTQDTATTPASFRIRNLSSSVQYFTHGSSSSVTSIGAPSSGNPSANTIGMLPNSVETFTGLMDWFIAGTSTGFEVIPGEGF